MVTFADIYPRGQTQSAKRPTRIAEKYYYVFKASNGLQVKVLRGAAPPTMMAGGIGGWNTVPRPRRTALTQWAGRDPYQMDVPVLFDRWHEQNSVEREIRQLNRMALGFDYQPPPTVKIQGALPVVGATWVISGIDWGEEVYWAQSKSGFYRLRQDAVVHLLQYQAEERLKIVVTKSLPNIYVVFNKNGESLKTIAKHVYGNAKKWRVIKKANPGPKTRDPNHIKYMTKLRIP